MANLDLLVLVGNLQKRTPSSGQTVDFTSIKVGVSALEMKETTGNFDFSAKKLVNILSGSAAGQALEYSQIGSANGIAGLDSGGKVPVSQLPNSIMQYQGVYNASTNSPALVNGTGHTGDVYRVSVAGAGVNSLNFVVGDYAIYNGTTWEKAHSGADAVVTVNGYAGIVVLATTDIAEGTNLYFTENRVRASLLTGYVSGAGIVTATDSFLSAINKLNGNNVATTVTANAALPSASFTDAAVTSKLITGYISGAGTIAATDSILQAINKLNGNDALKLTTAAFTDAAVTSKLITGFVSGAGVVSASDTILQAINKLDGNVTAAGTASSVLALINDNASAITVGKVVYIKANGNVDLAIASTANLSDFQVGIVQAASIAAAGTGNIYVKNGVLLSGFTGLIPGQKVWVSRSAAGSLTQSLTGFVAGEFVYSVGRAVSATQIDYNPISEFQY